MPPADRVRIGPAEIALTRIPSGPEVRGEVAHRRLERGLGHAHDVVVGDDLLGAVVAEGEDGAAAVEVRARLAGERDQRVRGHVQRQREPVARGVHEGAVEVLALGVGDGVDEDVDLALLLVPPGHHAPDVVVAGDVAGLHERAADGVRERADAALDEALHRREAHDGALVVEGPGDAPGDGVVVRDPEHERLAPLEQTHAWLLPSVPCASCPTRSRPTPRCVQPCRESAACCWISTAS